MKTFCNLLMMVAMTIILVSCGGENTENCENFTDDQMENVSQSSDSVEDNKEELSSNEDVTDEASDENAEADDTEDASVTNDESQVAQLLDEYESKVNEFISNQKNGMDILSNTGTYAEATELAAKIAECDLSGSQSIRFAKLQLKLNKAYMIGS